ncbi:MAG: thioredoxin domain-containing protein [Candidatus Brennerbacteria bacterium]|nr:thioredoxin domain-containing protein [Candidatus Brennerbacteria bacterium]
MDNETNSVGQKKRDVLLPASIIIAGVLVAGSVIWSVGKRAETVPADSANAGALEGPAIAAMRAVNENDQVRGSRDAKVVIVEYSDFECPFCKRFHDTMKATLEAYGDKVAWVYRHYPIATLHTKAAKESEASVCVAELGGNDAFWKFADRIFELTPSNNGLDPAQLPVIAEYAGVARDAFESCLASGRHAGVIAASVAEAESIGVSGTPYAVFIANDDLDKADFGFLAEVNRQFELQYPGQPGPFTIDDASDRIGMSGAFPFETVRQIMEVLIR